MQASKHSASTVAILCLLIAAVLLVTESSFACFADPTYHNPQAGQHYRTGDMMNIIFDIWFNNPPEDTQRPFFFYLYENYEAEDFRHYIIIEEFWTIGGNYTWDPSRGMWKAHVVYPYRVPHSQIFDTHTSICKITITIDLPVDQLGPSFSTEGWFTVQFIKKPPPEEPIPKKEEPEIP
jgi:hypothetical protein